MSIFVNRKQKILICSEEGSGVLKYCDCCSFVAKICLANKIGFSHLIQCRIMQVRVCMRDRGQRQRASGRWMNRQIDG